MATRNAYLAYKRDTSHLLYWIIKTSNSIIVKKASTAADEPVDAQDELPRQPNTTGQITVAGLINLSKLIAKHMTTISPTVYKLFDAVIKARSAAYEIFQQTTTVNRDVEVEKSNASHKYFIDALTEAFEALGGNTWKSTTSQFDSESDSLPSEKEDLDQLLLSNKFKALDLEGSDETSQNSDSEDPDNEAERRAAPRRRQQAKPGKGKKGKRGKKTKKKAPRTPALPDASLDDIPLESFGIIQDEEGNTIDYLMAIYGLVQQWASLRAHVQDVWHDAAYNGLNTAVAGAVSNVAISMIRRSVEAMFVNFPRRDTYEMIMNTITRGDVDKAQGELLARIHKAGSHGDNGPGMPDAELDLKEELLFHAYQDLIDFVEDFQKTRSGKPTKALLEQISHWDPEANLQNMSKDERIRWRRSYTINWLYDLVNVFSCIVVARINMFGERHVLEQVDWSTNGLWHQFRRIYGPTEFSGFVTSLAMQKQGTDIRKRILPHHVFQLQCIVDSFTVSRGWSLSALKGHVLVPPPRGFQPRRDLDNFMEPKDEDSYRGFFRGVQVLCHTLERDGLLNGDRTRNLVLAELLGKVQTDFAECLGETKDMLGLRGIPASRFADTRPNGLWEYSPFLCGTGLAEALELSYLVGMCVWDKLAEPLLIVHLHNMLVQTGYLKSPIPLFVCMEEFYPDSFYSRGTPPTADFMGELLRSVENAGSNPEIMRRQNRIRQAAYLAKQEIDHNFLDPDLNERFKTKSFLASIYLADWHAARILDADLPVLSELGFLRMAQTKQVVDPVTGKKKLQETNLVRKARAKGLINDEVISSLSNAFSYMQLHKTKEHEENMRRIKNVLSDGHGLGNSPLTKSPGLNAESSGNSGGGGAISEIELFKILLRDLYADICGTRPISAYNYICAAAYFMQVFHQIEVELSKRNNPVFAHVYEENRGQWRSNKRSNLVFEAMRTRNQECLEVMADILNSHACGWAENCYWRDLDTQSRTKLKFMEGVARRPDDERELGCNFM